jgi:hypothetical protein
MSGAPHTAESTVDEMVTNGLKALTDDATVTQEQVDTIVGNASVAALHEHGALARLAVEETGLGVFADEAVKNILTCEHVTHSMAEVRTVGVIRRDEIDGITEIADPVGLVCGTTPVTNPTSTAIFKAKMAAVLRHTGLPVLRARVWLGRVRDPAVARPAVVRAEVNLNGTAVRAHADGATDTEAIDLMHDRLQARVARITPR